jgi:hypothetical protein
MDVRLLSFCASCVSLLALFVHRVKERQWRVHGVLSGHATLEQLHAWKLFRFVTVLLVLSLSIGTAIVKESVSYIDIAGCVGIVSLYTMLIRWWY